MAEEKKVWKVLVGVPIDKLEDMLNEQVEYGLHAYRMDRIEKPVGPDGIDISYDVVMFNPLLLGERASKAFSDAIIAQMQKQPQDPRSGLIPGTE